MLVSNVYYRVFQRLWPEPIQFFSSFLMTIEVINKNKLTCVQTQNDEDVDHNSQNTMYLNFLFYGDKLEQQISNWQKNSAEYFTVWHSVMNCSSLVKTFLRVDGTRKCPCVQMRYHIINFLISNHTISYHIIPYHTGSKWFRNQSYFPFVSFLIIAGSLRVCSAWKKCECYATVKLFCIEKKDFSCNNT